MAFMNLDLSAIGNWSVLCMRDESSFFFPYEYLIMASLIEKSILVSLISNTTLTFIRCSSTHGSDSWILLCSTGQLMPISHWLNIPSSWYLVEPVVPPGSFVRFLSYSWNFGLPYTFLELVCQVIKFEKMFFFGKREFKLYPQLGWRENQHL